jgi:hypothetical protein
MYPTNLYILILKYFVFWATRKCKSMDMSIVNRAYFQDCKKYHFCVAENSNNLVLRFSMLLGYVINYIQFLFQFFETSKYIFWIFKWRKHELSNEI